MQNVLPLRGIINASITLTCLFLVFSLDDRIKKRVDVASEDKRLKKEILKVIDFKTRHHLEMQGHSQVPLPHLLSLLLLNKLTL